MIHRPDFSATIYLAAWRLSSIRLRCNDLIQSCSWEKMTTEAAFLVITAGMRASIYHHGAGLVCAWQVTEAVGHHQSPQVPVPVCFQTSQGDRHPGGENCSESHKMTLWDEAPQAGTGSARKRTDKQANPYAGA